MYKIRLRTLFSLLHFKKFFSLNAVWSLALLSPILLSLFILFLSSGYWVDPCVCVLMSLARRSRRSGNSSSSTASRKRKLAITDAAACSNSKQQRLDYPVELCSSQDLSLLDLDDSMSSPDESLLSAKESNNHKISLTNSHATKPGATGVNHGKKTGTGKKIVIKNLKGGKNTK